jgi:hypothetical protein
MGDGAESGRVEQWPHGSPRTHQHLISAGDRMTTLTRTLVLLVGLTACGDSANCLALPCPLGMAVTLKVTSATTGAPIDSATVSVTGASTESFPCNGACSVGGGPGTYIIHVTSPGFAPADRTVNVSGTNPKCGCATADTQNVTIALAAAN